MLDWGMDFFTDQDDGRGDILDVEVVRERVDDTFLTARMLDGLVEDEFAINRRAFRRAVGVQEVVAHVRRHPEIYTVGDRVDDLDHAFRSVVFEVSLRLQISEDEVRRTLCTVETAQESLPLMWERAEDGFAAMRFVDAAVGAALRLRAPVGATPEQQEYATGAIALIDRASAEWVLHLSLPAFRRRLKVLADRLDPEPAAQRHGRGMADRRVVLEEAEDGMSWIMALVPTVKAVAIKRRLTSTAKHLQKDKREQRTRDQLRADLFTDWLCGVGTSTAVKTTVFVTVPVGLLSGGSPTDSASEGTVAPGGVPFASGEARNPVTSLGWAQLVGHGPIDPLTARQAFLDAPAFRRVITDPVRGVVLDMDRRTYRPTTAQRDWLVLQYGTCARDGCTRLALDADLDHERMWARGGRTDVGNLRPLCPADHARNHRTRFHLRSRPDRTVQVTSPTGFHTTDPPPF
ncbi:MAG: DUF222 domain-containing protein [Actinobacteria bacterium]|nr:DUF222 domain-containing protein [Actinomycetota bacterium]